MIMNFKGLDLEQTLFLPLSEFQAPQGSAACSPEGSYHTPVLKPA